MRQFQHLHEHDDDNDDDEDDEDEDDDENYDEDEEDENDDEDDDVRMMMIKIMLELTQSYQTSPFWRRDPSQSPRVAVPPLTITSNIKCYSSHNCIASADNLAGLNVWNNKVITQLNH